MLSPAERFVRELIDWWDEAGIVYYGPLVNHDDGLHGLITDARAIASVASVAIPQEDLPEEAARLLREHAWSLYGDEVKSVAQPARSKYRYACLRCSERAGTVNDPERHILHDVGTRCPQDGDTDQGSSDIRPPAAPVSGSGWLPITTAPRDGTEILLTDGHWKRTGYWARRVEIWSVDTAVTLSAPTHWMSLPPTPDGVGVRRGSDDHKTDVAPGHLVVDLCYGSRHHHIEGEMGLHPERVETILRAVHEALD